MRGRTRTPTIRPARVAESPKLEEGGRGGRRDEEAGAEGKYACTWPQLRLLRLSLRSPSAVQAGAVRATFFICFVSLSARTKTPLEGRLAQKSLWPVATALPLVQPAGGGRCTSEGRVHH